MGKDWQYFAFPDNVKPHFLYDSEGNAELVLLVSVITYSIILNNDHVAGPQTHQLQKPCVTNTTVNGVPAYATSDIMSPHPTKPGFWKVYGRADDQIMHNTGEKVNTSGTIYGMAQIIDVFSQRVDESWTARCVL